MNNPFQKIIDTGKNIFAGGSSQTAVGIDIGTSMIKVVEIKKKGGKALLETYGSVALGPYADLEVGRVTNLPPDKLSMALQEVLKESGVSTRASALAIPSHASLVFNLEIPPQVKESELSSVIPTEAKKYIPVPMNEVTLDYFVLPQKESSFEEENNPDLPKREAGKTEVLVVAIQNDTISKYQSIVNEVGLETSFLELEIFSSIRANFEHELSPVMLMDFGAYKTRLSIVEFGSVRLFHTINRGSADISDSISKGLGVQYPKAEEMKKEFGLYGNPADKNLSDIMRIHCDYIVTETRGVVSSYEKKYNKTVGKIILTGGGSLLKGFKELIANSFTMEVVMGAPFSKVSAPAFLDKVLLATGPEFATAIGLALRKLQ